MGLGLLRIERRSRRPLLELEAANVRPTGRGFGGVASGGGVAQKMVGGRRNGADAQGEKGVVVVVVVVGGGGGGGVGVGADLWRTLRRAADAVDAAGAAGVGVAALERPSAPPALCVFMWALRLFTLSNTLRPNNDEILKKK